MCENTMRVTFLSELFFSPHGTEWKFRCYHDVSRTKIRGIQNSCTNVTKSVNFFKALKPQSILDHDEVGDECTWQLGKPVTSSTWLIWSPTVLYTTRC